MTDAFRKNPDAKTANLAGKINNIFVVDVDKPKKDEIDGARFFSGLMENNEKTLTFKSPSGGRHYYFQYDDEIDLSFLRLRKKRTDEEDDVYSIDLLNNGKYAVVYDVLVYDAPIQKMPENVKEFIKNSENHKNKKTINGNNKKETAEKKTDKTKTNIPNNIEFNTI